MVRKSRLGSKASEGHLLKLMSDLIECNKAVFNELNIIKQSQRDMHRKLQEISVKVESINKDELYKKLSTSKVLDVTIKKQCTEEEYKAVLEVIKKEKLEDVIFT